MALTVKSTGETQAESLGRLTKVVYDLLRDTYRYVSTCTALRLKFHGLTRFVAAGTRRNVNASADTVLLLESA